MALSSVLVVLNAARLVKPLPLQGAANADEQHVQALGVSAVAA
jgi:hypothetical protein